MKPGDRAWATLAAGVIAYEAFAPKGELLSESYDRFRRAHPILAYAVLLYVATHLSRLIPNRVDPLTQLAVRLGR